MTAVGTRNIIESESSRLGGFAPSESRFSAGFAEAHSARCLGASRILINIKIPWSTPTAPKTTNAIRQPNNPPIYVAIILLAITPK